ncbi:MAG: FixH family protein [Micropepsaceae bacterium]
MTRTLTGRHVLLIFLAFFLTVTGVNVLMVTFAVKTFSGEDTATPYVKGLAYNETIAREEREARSGYAVAIAGARDSDGRVEVTIDVTQSGAPAAGIAATGRLRHPTNAHLDRDLPLAPAADGRFAATLETLSPGQWDIEVTLTRDGAEVYQARSRLWLP